MCGIAGIMTLDGMAPDGAVLQSLMRALALRGPDGDGMAPDDDADGSGFGATDGEAVYVSTGCAGCHCDDGAGGCALSAPAVAGAAADVLDAVLRGEAIHPVRVDISDPDLADLEAYLAAL